MTSWFVSLMPPRRRPQPSVISICLDRARERDLKLNIEKVKLSVPHILTDKGLAPDPQKYQLLSTYAITHHIKSLRQLLGMTKYLSKFWPQLSVVTEPFHQLSTRMPTGIGYLSMTLPLPQWRNWSLMPCRVLCYLDPMLPVTLQCDASEDGLGYALLQQSQPIATGPTHSNRTNP